MQDRFKQAFMELLVSAGLPVGMEQALSWLTTPPRPDMGDYAFPCFRLAKTLKKKPELIAEELAAAAAGRMNKHPLLASVTAAGAYVNTRVRPEAFIAAAVTEILGKMDSYGDTTEGEGKTIVIDFSSPNLAKPFHVGHLMTTIIGATLARLFETCGYRIVRINHLGDWGVQTGFQVLAWNRLGDKKRLEKEGLDYLCDLYITVNRAAMQQNSAKNTLEKHLPFLGLAEIFDSNSPAPELQKSLEAYDLDGATGSTLYRLSLCEEAVAAWNSSWSKWDCCIDNTARAIFKRCEAGDEEVLSAWRMFRKVTLDELESGYERLRVAFDEYKGEAYFAQAKDERGRRLTDAIVDELLEKGLAKESRGALVVELPASGKEKFPPVLIRKADEATLYATRDLAAAKWRYETYRFHKNIYVTDHRQELHFRSVFKVLEMAGYDWARDCEFVPYGLIKIREESGGRARSMTTRGGRMIPLKKLLDRMVEKVREIVEEANPSLANKESVCEAVGSGAVVFWAQARGRMRDAVFDLEKATQPTGDTGPYLQYAHARMCSLARKAAERLGITPEKIKESDLSLLDSPEELTLAKRLAAFPAALVSALERREPYELSRYLLDLAADYAVFWREKRVLDAPAPVGVARLALSEAARVVVAKGLRLLGMSAPEEM